MLCYVTSAADSNIERPKKSFPGTSLFPTLVTSIFYIEDHTGLDHQLILLIGGPALPAVCQLALQQSLIRK